MGYFHHQTIKKYTAALLDLFNDIEVQYLDSKGNIKEFKVPIQFSSQEKSTIISQYDIQQIFTKSSTILPRMSLVFESLEPAENRALNKFVKISKVIENRVINFQYNSVPYNFNFRVVAQTRGMSEAAQIIEQVCSYFNPSYTLKIKEVPYSGYTSIVLGLSSTDIEIQEYDEYSSNIITITFNLILKGNIYPAIRSQGPIEELEIFLKSLETDQNFSKTLIKQDVFEKKSVSSIKSYTDNPNKYRPKIIDIVKKEDKLEVIFEDRDLENSEFRYFWYYNGVNTGDSGDKIVKFTQNKGVTNVLVKIVDMQGGKSEIFEKSIEI